MNDGGECTTSLGGERKFLKSWNMSDKRPTFAHIINPVIVGPQSDLYIAQPITFESMRRAKAAAAPGIEVELYTAQYSEDRDLVPHDFTMTSDLERSVMDFGRFVETKKLPLIRDILDRLYESSSAEYFIYTNVDIALQEYFYTAVQEIIDSGIDGMVINRRTITDKYTSVYELPQMYAESGESHYGYDCFIFRRDIYPRFDLGNTAIGLMAVGAILMMNIICFSKSFKEFLDLYLTFHIGNTETWRNPNVVDFQKYNHDEYHAVLRRLAPKLNTSRLPVISRPFIMQYFEQVRKMRGL